MKPTGTSGQIYYGTSEGQFVRQRMQFCTCSFCFRTFDFNERVIFFHDRTYEYYVCLDHEQQMRERQIQSYEATLKMNRAWEAEKKKLIEDLKLKRKTKNDDAVKE